MTIGEPTPFLEAYDFAKRKQTLKTTLPSRELSKLDGELKQRAVFSARMNTVGPLNVLLDNLKKIASGTGIAEENGRLRSIPEAKAQLKEAMYASGVRIAPVGTPKIQDFYSDERRSLMVETTVLDTLNAGRHIASQDPVALSLNPGLELVRMVVPKGGPAAERDWPQRWKDAMDEIGDAADDGCTDPDEDGGRMVALVNHPIWQALGDGAGGYDDSLGNPWAPFAFNSGMNTIAVSRRECIALGIMDAHQAIEPDDSININEGMEASVEKFQGVMRDALVGAGLEIVRGVLKIANTRRQLQQEQIMRKRLQIRRFLNHLDREAA